MLVLHSNLQDEAWMNQKFSTLGKLLELSKEKEFVTVVI
jgi:hypothetical protein